jgi:hypothetical protein
MHFFGLVTLPSEVEFVIYTNRSKWVPVVGVIMAFVCLHNHGKSLLKIYSGFLTKYLTVITISVIILYFHAIIMYPLNGLLTTYGFGTYYFYAFFAIPLIYIFEQERGFEHFIQMVNVIAVIMYTVSIIQGIYYIRTGSLLFAMANTEITGSMVRDGMVRIDAGAFGNIMLIYNIYNLVNIRSKNRRNIMISVIVIVLGLLNIYFTGQTRVVLLTMIAVFVILIILGDGSKNKKVIAGFLLLIGAVTFIFSGFPIKILSSFSSTGSLAGSTIARTNALSYYLDQFIKNPIFAIGFAGDVNYYNLVHGDSGIYFQTVLVRYDYTDVGYIGQLAKTGIFSVFICLWPLFHFIKIAFNFRIRRINVPGAFLIALSFYLVLTSATLIIFDGNRVIAFPLVIAIFEYSFKHIQENKVQE